MTLPFHCPIQPQEHVFSWLNRIHLLFGHIKQKDTLDFLGVANKPFKNNHQNTAFMDAIMLYKQEIRNDSSGFDHHSAIPLWSLTFDSDYYQDCIRQIKEELPSGYDTGRYAFQSNWKYCPSCVRADIKECGHSFWHVKHQLSGVTHCYIHGERLSEDNHSLKDLRNASIPQVHCFTAQSHEDELILREWSLFVASVYDLVSANSLAGKYLADQVRTLLDVPKELTYRDNEMFKPLQIQFDTEVPSSLLRFLFLVYRPDSKRSLKLLQNTLGYRYSSRYSIPYSHPICWLIILFWLKDKIAWDCSK